MADQPNVDLEALSDLCTPWCIRAAVTLRIAEHIADGTSGIDDLAGATDCDADSLGRVLRHLANKGVFEEPLPGQFALNSAAQQLLASGVHSASISTASAAAWRTRGAPC
jgi:hypothetical protein